MSATVYSLAWGDDLTPQQIYTRSIDSVCTVVAMNNGKPSSLGTGFLISTDGLVATNQHVVDGADAVVIKCGKTSPVTATHMYPYGGIDITVLETPLKDTHPLAVSTSTTENLIGGPVIVIGNPEGLEGSVTNGIVSGIRVIGKDNYIQISAPISHGSSGGPVFLANGDVIGITTSMFEGGQNLNFALPAMRLRDLSEIAMRLSLHEETVGQAFPGRRPKPNSAPVELGEIVKAFTFSQKYDEAVGWDISYNVSVPIEWLSDGLVTDNRGLVRKGRLRATVYGKKMYALRKEPEELYWNVDVVGWRGGIEYIDISPDNACFGGANSGCDYDFERAMKITNISAKEICALHNPYAQIVMYTLSSKGKRDAIACVLDGCGSGGCTTNLEIHYKMPDGGAASNAQCEKIFHDRTNLGDAEPGRWVSKTGAAQRTIPTK